MRNKVFISYAHLDQEETDWMKKLKKHLGFFQRKNLLNIWDDSKLTVGGDITSEIVEVIDQSRIAILLVGPAFLGSGFINDIELPRILEAARADGLQIFPLVTGYCSYTKSDLKDLKAFNNIGKPLEALSAHEQNEILYKFCNILEDVYNSRHVGVLDPKAGVTYSHSGLQKLWIKGKRLTTCEFTSHRNQLLCAGFDSEIFNADVGTGNFESLRSVSSIARAIFRFPGSSVFLVGYDNGDVYSVNSDLVNFHKCFSCRSSVFHIAFNSLRNTVITSEKNGEVNEWKVENIEAVTLEEEEPQITFLNLITTHTSNVFMSAFSPALNSSISISASGALATLDYRTGKVKMDNSFGGYSLYAISIAKNGLVVIGGSQGRVFVVTPHFRRKEITLHTDTVRSLVVTSGGKWLFTGSKDKSLKVRNLESDRTWILYTCTDYIYDVRFSEEYNQFLATDGSGHLFLFSFEAAIDTMDDEDMDQYVKQIK